MVSYASWSVQLGSTHILSLGSEVSAGHWQGSRAKDIFGHLITLKFDYVCVCVNLCTFDDTNQYSLSAIVFQTDSKQEKAQINEVSHPFEIMWSK